MKAAIFDLDGVLVDTAACHYLAWRELAAELGFELTEQFNERLKGTSRERSLELILQAAGVDVSVEERRRLADRKNARYLELVSHLTSDDLLPGARRVLEQLRERGILLALGSASRNAGLVLERLGIRPLLDAVVDGTVVAAAKPDPEVFLAGAEMLGVDPAECLVFEDAEVGIDAAHAAGMRAVGVGDLHALRSAERVVPSLAALDVDALFPVRA